MRSPRATGLTLLLCLAAAQAALLVLTPVLAPLAAGLGVSTALAGQLRTVSGLAAGVTALATGLAAARVGLRRLVGAGLVAVALGSMLSAVAPDFTLLAVAQLVVGVGVGLSYSASVAAVAEWSSRADRSGVLALALLGPPLAWVVGMPVAGLAGEVSWRLVWLAVPLVLAVLACATLAGQPESAPAATRADVRRVFRHPGVLRWSLGELFAYSAWAGALVFIGALFVESYGLSIAATGLVLGAGALVYLPGNLVFRRFVDEHDRMLLIALALSAAVVVALLGAWRPSLWLSLGLFAALSFLAGGRTLAGGARGLDLAPELRLGVTGVRTAAIQLGYFVGAAIGGLALGSGGYRALGLAFAALFVAAAATQLVPTAGDPPGPLR
jgi:predicted MFS family arabinose efflux permease